MGRLRGRRLLQRQHRLRGEPPPDLPLRGLLARAAPAHVRLRWRQHEPDACRSTAACWRSSRPPAASRPAPSARRASSRSTPTTSDLVMRKVTAGAADSSFPMLNKVGTQVTFQSSADLLSTQLDTGIQQIFWSDYDRRRHRHTIHQLTNGNADSEHAYSCGGRAAGRLRVVGDRPAGERLSRRAGGRSTLRRVDTEPVPDLPPVTQLTDPDGVRQVQLAGGRTGEHARCVHLHAGPDAARHAGQSCRTRSTWPRDASTACPPPATSWARSASTRARGSSASSPRPT